MSKPESIILDEITEFAEDKFMSVKPDGDIFAYIDAESGSSICWDKSYLDNPKEITQMMLHISLWSMVTMARIQETTVYITVSEEKGYISIDTDEDDLFRGKYEPIKHLEDTYYYFQPKLQKKSAPKPNMTPLESLLNSATVFTEENPSSRSILMKEILETIDQYLGLKPLNSNNLQELIEVLLQITQTSVAQILESPRLD